MAGPNDQLPCLQCFCRIFWAGHYTRLAPVTYCGRNHFSKTCVTCQASGESDCEEIPQTWRIDATGLTDEALKAYIAGRDVPDSSKMRAKQLASEVQDYITMASVKQESLLVRRDKEIAEIRRKMESLKKVSIEMESLKRRVDEMESLKKRVDDLEAERNAFRAALREI